MRRTAAFRQIRRSPYSSRSARVSSAPTHSSPVGASTLWRFRHVKLKLGRNDEGASWNDFGSSGHSRGTTTVAVRNEFGTASGLSTRNECGPPSAASP